MAISEEELEIRFTFHPVQGDQGEKYQFIRSMAKTLAIQIVDVTPESREQSLALTALDEVVFWANAAIARRE